MDQNKVKSEEPKVLLTQGEDGKLKVITGEQDGKLKTVEPTKENADQFLKVDTNSNFLENFFKKMSAQFNHPSHTGVYAIRSIGKKVKSWDSPVKNCRMPSKQWFMDISLPVWSTSNLPLTEMSSRCKLVCH